MARPFKPNTNTRRRHPNLVREEWDRGLVTRMQRAVGMATCREIGLKTGVHPETVRRYLIRGRPTIFFIAMLCKAFNVSPEWMLHGKGSPPATGGQLRRPGKIPGGIVPKGYY